MTVAVLGVGLIGGSVGLAARRLGEEVVGYDPDPASLERGIAEGALDRGAGDVAEACAGAATIFCAAPVAVLPELIAAALGAAGEEAVVTDVGSIKRGLAAAFADEQRFIGGHPLAGAETAGVENARADLFEGARWYLTPGEATSGVLFDRLRRLIADLGARPEAIEAAEHDRVMAVVSHLPHVLADVLVGRAADELGAGSGRLPEVGPSFRDATRVAGSNPAIWGDIFAANGDAVAAAVEAAIEDLREAADLLRAGDAGALRAWHAAAARRRRELTDAARPEGGLRELRAIVPNRPGVVAELALALAEGGVNIEDMSLDPAPDMRSGAVRIWVAGDEQAERAGAIVRDRGHAVSEPGAGR